MLVICTDTHTLSLQGEFGIRSKMRGKITFDEALPRKGLPIDVYQHWFNAIVQDKASDVEKILLTGKKEVLLNGRFLYHKEPELLFKTRKDGRPPFELTRPLCLAVALNAHNTIDVLDRNGSDIMVKDVNGKHLMFHYLKI